ncbi:hypothetical protein Y032_0023g867 [Ancylostoma ceylanicum]|uniref:Uncharacterized protein n=1 Tax=Ancylostoma ceylanicum TaxID=53326 RepID=A0A016UZA5_9BILA|nr:hypothetical protein Y032_0023g867 [Ancylostoma ceylanicum]
MQTPGYESALAKQWSEHQGTGPPWPSSAENPTHKYSLVKLSSRVIDRVRVGLLGQSMVQTPGYGSALAKQWSEHQGTVRLGQAVRRTPFTSPRWSS